MKSIPELCKERVVFGAWTVKEEDLATEERCRWMKEAGIDFVYYSISHNRDEAIRELDMLDKFDMGMMAFDNRASGLPMDRFWCLKNAVKDYVQHPACVGTSLRDEPGVYDLPRLKLLSETFIKETGKLPGINLFPSYANELQFNYVDFREYIAQCAKALDLPYISYDHYPLYGGGGRTWVQQNYFSDFEITSDACREYGRDLWYFIQTLGFNHIVREPNEQDIRWQIYCALSFGAKVIQLFTYNSPGDANGDTADETFELAMIDRQGQKTPRYGYVQNVVNEIHKFDGTYVQYKHIGAMVNKNGYEPVEGDEVEITFPGMTFMRKIPNNYLDLAHPLDAFGPIAGIAGELPVLAGCFEQGDKRAFTLVNAADPGLRLGNQVQVNFTEPVKLRVWSYGEATEIDVDGVFETTLDCGQGLFIEIL